MRRIQRRMQVLQTHEVPSYIEQLRSQPTEAALMSRCGIERAKRVQRWERRLR